MGQYEWWPDRQRMAGSPWGKRLGHVRLGDLWYPPKGRGRNRRKG